MVQMVIFFIHKADFVFECSISEVVVRNAKNREFDCKRGVQQIQFPSSSIC